MEKKTKEWSDPIYNDTPLTDKPLTIEHVRDVLIVPSVSDAAKLHGLDRLQTISRLMPLQTMRNKEQCTFPLLTKQISEFVDINCNVYIDNMSCLCFLGIVPAALIEGLGSAPTPSELLMTVSSNYFRIKHERYRFRHFFYEFAISDYVDSPGVGDNIKELICTRQS